MNSSIESSSPTTTTAIATNKEDGMLLSPSSASPINNDVVDEILKQATPPSPSVLINSYVYTPTKHILSLDGGSSRSNSSNSINTSSPTGQPQQQTEKQQQKRQNKSQRQSHQKTSPIPLKYSPTLLSASSPILARASPVNVALRHQSQSPLASKEKTQPVLSPQSVASGRRLLQRKRKRGHFEKNHLHHLRNRRTHGSQTIDRRIQALTKQNPIKRDALPDILTINDIREELMMLILRYLPRNKDFLNNILLTSKRMWKIGNSHWCWIDVNDILPPTPSPPPTTVMCMSSSNNNNNNNNNNINISTEEDEHQVVLNHPRYSKRLNWANFKFINCRKKGNSSSSSSSNNNNNHEIEDDSNTNKNTSTPPSKDKGNSSKGSSSSSSCYYSGTEGDLFKALQRSTGKFIAIKKARVYPRQEGVPYYMLRELSFLKNLSHPNISQLKNAYLHKDQLYCFFDFIEYTLHEVINPMRSRNCGEALSEKHAKMFTLQILDGIRYCHSRGVLHRNLKPKHLLVKMRDPNDLSTACIKICDFALVRSTNIPIRTYTNEVVTLWYRPPEVLMGDKYFLPIDVWSIGCIFGEMLLGKPLFPGISEIDQLFQIFSTLGTPSRSEWEGFQELPNYSFAFPNWKQKNISKVFPKLSANGRHLLLKTLVMDPRKRISAREAVAHPYFSDLNYNNCHVPSFPPRGGHRALGLRINHMDTIEKVNTSISIDLQPLQKKQKRNGIVVSADDTTTTTTTTTTSSNNNNEAADAMMMINSTEMEESSIAVNKKVGGYTFHYLGEFHAFLRTVENERFPLVDWMALHNIISLNHREMLVDWLVEVVDVFDMSIRSVYLAVQFVDRYIGQKLIKRESFQLVGATCLHIASKCEDVSYIGVEDLAVCADNVYLSQDVLSKEEEILNDLDFNLSSATVLDFVILYLEYFPYTERKKEVVWLSRYLCELSLQQYDLSVLARPSKVAAACICWALHCLKLPKWESWLSAISGYHWRTVEALYDSVANMHKKINDQSNKLKVIKQRYSKPRRMQVALIEIPKV